MELGSEFDLSINLPTTQKQESIDVFSRSDVLFFDSGRNALRFAMTSKPNGKILLPEYICESVISIFNKNDICFYSLSENFQINIEDVAGKLSTNDIRYFYYINYFGSDQNRDIQNDLLDLKKKFNFYIIQDVTHDLLSHHVLIGDLVYGSIRKWFPVPDGGFAARDISKIGYEELKLSLPSNKTYAMLLKEIYLKTSIDCNDEYRYLFTHSEDELDNEIDSKRISTLTKFLIRSLDIESIRKRRKENYSYLENKLCNLGISPLIQIMDSDCPLVFPIKIDDRDELRSYLISKKIYCAVHWPFDGFIPQSRRLSINMSDNELSLPIDQRYDLSHIQYLVDCIEDFYA